MNIPFPTLNMVKEQAKNGIPAAKLIIASIIILSYATGEKDTDLIYDTICKRARGEDI